MTLNEYLMEIGESQEVFAKKAGIGLRSMNRYCYHSRIPIAKNIKKIEIATNGKVRYQDFYKQSLEKINELMRRNQIRLKMLCPVLNISEPALLKKLQGKTVMAMWEFESISDFVKEFIKNNKEKKHG
jgi:hypothetical protein